VELFTALFMTQTKISLFIFFWLISVSLVAQTPYAEILNQGANICESGNIILSIKFYGEAPFGIRYKIGTTTYTIDGQGSNIINLDKLSAENVWLSPETIHLEIPENEASLTTSVEILRVWDNTIPTPWTVSNGSEISDQSIQYTSFKMPDISAGNDIDSCGLSAILDGTPDPVSSTFYWHDQAPGTLSAIDDRNAIFTAPGEGTYSLTLVQENGACQTTDTVEVTLKGSPAGTLTTASEVCGETAQSVTLDFQFSGNGPWDYSFSDGSNTFSNTSSNATTSETLSVNGESVFSINWLKDVNGCKAQSEQIEGTTTVIDFIPTPNAGDDQAICGQEISLEAIESAYPGTWSGPLGVTFDDPGNVNTTVSASAYGEYTLTWTEMNGTCPAADQVNVRFDQMPTPVNAGTDKTLYYQYETTLAPLEPTAGEGLWSILSGSGQLSSEPFPNTQISDLEMGVTTLLWSVANGLCPTLTDTLVITVKGLTYHTGFSPNGDGFNDSFKILGASQIPNNELIVFTQYGKVVYRKKDLTEEGWDGKDPGGSLLDDGTYFFVFTGDHIKALKDYLLIKTR
jgi:gliding motility-associated-like protein